uniref:CNH domain-containing protein n=1 Tax=Macrostomum lignano TaxID=282301 RepID=A0A1I8HMC6_9PLAT
MPEVVAQPQKQQQQQQYCYSTEQYFRLPDKSLTANRIVMRNEHCLVAFTSAGCLLRFERNPTVADQKQPSWKEVLRLPLMNFDACLLADSQAADERLVVWLAGTLRVYNIDSLECGSFSSVCGLPAGVADAASGARVAKILQISADEMLLMTRLATDAVYDCSLHPVCISHLRLPPESTWPDKPPLMAATLACVGLPVPPERLLRLQYDSRQACLHCLTPDGRVLTIDCLSGWLVDSLAVPRDTTDLLLVRSHAESSILALASPNSVTLVEYPSCRRLHRLSLPSKLADARLLACRSTTVSRIIQQPELFVWGGNSLVYRLRETSPGQQYQRLLDSLQFDEAELCAKRYGLPMDRLYYAKCRHLLDSDSSSASSSTPVSEESLAELVSCLDKLAFSTDVEYLLLLSSCLKGEGLLCYEV